MKKTCQRLKEVKDLLDAFYTAFGNIELDKGYNIFIKKDELNQFTLTFEEKNG